MNDQIFVKRFEVGDMVKRMSKRYSGCEAYYIVISTRVDDAGWIWYNTFSIGTGSINDFLLSDNDSRKYELAA